MAATLPPPSSDDAPAFWLIADQLCARTESERLRYLHSGFPPNWVKATREAFRLNNQQLEVLLNASISTLERRQRQQQPLDLVSSERLERVATLAKQAALIFHDQDTAQRWMITGNTALDEQTPIELCTTEIGARQIRRVLAGLEHGGVV